ncbi:MAG: hypothetical protein IKM06_02240 [Clostridia bacterium]|nr:hypothetical protein [Clostridia bacterium]
MAEIKKSGTGHTIAVNGKECVFIPAHEGASDRFEPIEEGVWKWHRHTSAPTDAMRMELILLGGAEFTMIPALSYNGNGWGTTPEYVGDRAEDGTPWSFASHRVSIPSCTYSENSEVSIALMAEAEANTACSLYKTDEGEKHVLIFPEEEKPKTLHRHFWDGPFQGSMEPTQDFEAIIFLRLSDGSKHRYKFLLDFAWRYYAHPVKPQKSASTLYPLSIAFSHYLLQKELDGFVGFTNGAQWIPSLNSYQKLQHNYEIGWIGQCASLAAAFIYDYKINGNKENLDIGISVLDSWLRHYDAEKGILPARINYPSPSPTAHMDLENMTRDEIIWEIGEAQLEGILRDIDRMKRQQKENVKTEASKTEPPKKAVSRNDACNLGIGAEGFFEAYDLLKSIGIDKPEYSDVAFSTCLHAIKSQDENGAFAKSWDEDGNIIEKDGTIGCFLILPLLNAYRRTKENKYLDSAIRAFDFYYCEFEREGFTTAGALDTYSIDKESASPLARAALGLYEATQNSGYIVKAEKAAWYLCTWMLHYTIKYPKECVINQLNYDTLGATSVSTPHNALDQFALRDLPSFLKLFELTGNTQWKERAIAIWCNATQGISDGTLIVNGRLRPAGSQDEAICHTRWKRNTTPPFTPTQWLTAWPCAIRLENLRWQGDWSLFDNGLEKIEGKIK